MIETTTIPNVELCRTGTWKGSTGEVTITQSHLSSIVDASQDTEIDMAPVKIGHIDPRFDGQPAFGWIQNQRVVGDRVLGDLAGVPVKLAEVVKLAFRRRSAELRWNMRTPKGRTYACVLSGLALLGATPPAVKGMGDLLGLFSEEDPQENATWVELATDLSEPGAHTDNVTTKTPPGGTVDETAIRKLFGIDDGADLTEALGGIATKLAAKDDPDVVKVSKAVWDDTIAKATKGAEAADRLTEMSAKDAVTKALTQGRIAPADEEKWVKRLTTNFAEEYERLNELAPGVRMNTGQRSDERTSVELAEGRSDTFSDDELQRLFPEFRPDINKAAN